MFGFGKKKAEEQKSPEGPTAAVGVMTMDTPPPPPAPPRAKSKGLPMAFSQGEKLPWKGIWFEVEAVEFDTIVLRPVAATAAARKR